MILKTWNIILTICVIVYPFVSILREAVTNIITMYLVTVVTAVTAVTGVTGVTVAVAVMVVES